MDYDLHVMLHIPRPPTSAFDPGTWDGDIIAVPTDLVDYAIEVLRCYLAHWTLPEGFDPEDQAYNALNVAAGHTLAGLLASRAASGTQRGASQLIEQIAQFFCWHDADHYLESQRTADNADIVDALLAVHAERERQGRGQGQG
jgi:hypothetical protein